MESFDWEEFYLFGNQSKAEFEKARLKQASSMDDFIFINLVEDDYDNYEGIFVNVKRVSDKKKFTLPLMNLKVVDENTPEYQIISDYSSWIVNNVID
jgi:hypothetical protein